MAKKRFKRAGSAIRLHYPAAPDNNRSTSERELKNDDYITCLIQGPSDLDGSFSFKNAEEEKEYWELNKGFIMGLQGNGDYGFPYGNRPLAWWKYQHGELPEGAQYFGFCPVQYEYLEKHNLLFDGERELVEERELARVAG